MSTSCRTPYFACTTGCPRHSHEVTRRYMNALAELLAAGGDFLRLPARGLLPQSLDDYAEHNARSIMSDARCVLHVAGMVYDLAGGVVPPCCVSDAEAGQIREGE